MGADCPLTSDGVRAIAEVEKIHTALSQSADAPKTSEEP
jgi:hypothetical protein